MGWPHFVCFFPPAFSSSMIVSAGQGLKMFERMISLNVALQIVFYFSLAQRGCYIMHSIRCHSQHLGQQ